VGRGRRERRASAQGGVSAAIQGVVAALRVLADPRIATAIGGLADALDAHAAGQEPPVLSTESNAGAAQPPAEPIEVTDEHRREAARRLRRRGVLR
jgi:hypothetical protein